MTDPALHPETVAVHAGRPPKVPDGPLNAPIVPASALHPGGPSGYARDGSPAWQGLEEALGHLEGGTAVTFASGMSAVAAILRLVPPGARIVAPTVLYMRVREALAELDEAGRAHVTWVDLADTDAVIDACASAEVLWIESPSNPLLDVADVPALCAYARQRGLLCAVDNTLATPLAQRPLALGADLALHSATKFIGGHADLLLGAVVARDPEVARRLVHAREVTGGTPGALEAFLALRGLRTLPLRLERAQANADVLARRLAEHPDVTHVRYPGLETDPAHARAAATMDGFGAMLTFRVTGGAARADALVDRVRVFTHATSFGAVESTLERRARYPAERDVPEDLLRVAVGVEHVDDLWRDLDDALAATASVAPDPVLAEAWA